MPHDPMTSNPTRRQWLQGLLAAWPAASIGAMPASAAAPRPASVRVGRPSTVLAACWEQVNAFQVGLLAADGPGHIDDTSIDQPLRELASLSLPTRAHGLAVEPGGSVLVVARRPGDWLLRWHPDGRPPQWQWIEPQRAFNGHAVLSADGRTLYTTETDLDSGAGCIGVRDARTLAKRAEWPTHGIDAHQLVWDRRRPQHLIVANGGVAIAPETGRAKLGLSRMDSSLVRLDAQTGRLDGQWRLDDPRLSLRHLAWSADDSMTLGIAMQAEHDDPDTKAAAPVLALFDGERLRAVPSPQGPASAPVPTLAGYGGDIAAHADRFFISCPRAPGLAHFSTRGEWRGFTDLPEACALAVDGDRLWSGGRPRAAALSVAPDDAAHIAATRLDVAGRRLDNHWVVLPAESAG